MENNNTKILEIPDYDFLKGKLTQTKALKTLSKLIKYNGKVCYYYEMIEIFPSGLAVENDNIYSSRSEKGYVTKLCIGNHICSYKVEADYYHYLCNGGRKYSEYLTEIKEIKNHNEFVRKQQNEEQQAYEIQKYRQEHEENIRIALISSIEEYIERALGSARKKLEEFRSQRQTKYVKDEIEYFEKFISSRTKLASETHIWLNRIYVLNGGSVEEKFTYNIGCNVTFHQRGVNYKTSIVEKRENRYGYYSYKVSMVEGIVNPWCGYYDLLPDNLEEG